MDQAQRTVHPKSERSKLSPGVRQLRRLGWWASVAAALLVPLALSDKIGYVETWEAFDRYQGWLLALPSNQSLHVPAADDVPRNYAALDRDLIAWHERMGVIYDRIAGMAVVGRLENGDTGVEFQFGRQAGANKRKLKGQFHWKRDLSMLVYFLLSAVVYFVDSVPLSLVVANLNLFNIAICLRLKGLSDGITKAIDSLQDAESDFLSLPLETGQLELLQQTACLAKLHGVIGAWQGTQFGFNITLASGCRAHVVCSSQLHERILEQFLSTWIHCRADRTTLWRSNPVLHRSVQPVIHAITVSISIMISLAAATTVRCLHVIVYGFWPSLPRVSLTSLLQHTVFFGSRQTNLTDAAHMLEERETARQAGGSGDGGSDGLAGKKHN